MRHRMRLGPLTAAITGVLLLSGCVGQTSTAGSTSASAAGGATGAGASSSAPEDAPTTVTVWSWFNKATMQKAIDQFEAENPGTTVEYSYYNYDPEFITALKAAANSDTLPDIIGLQPGSLTQEYREQLTPMNDLATQSWGADWEDKLFPAVAAQMRMGNPTGDDGVYIMPHEAQVLTTWYNTQIFAELGLSVPTTMDELVAASAKIKDAGYLPMYQGAAGAWQNENVFLILANQLKSGITDQAQLGKVPWTSPELVTAMKTWGELFTNGVFQDGALGAQAYPTGAQLFAAGKVGMFTIGSWFLQNPQLPDQPSLVQGLKGFDFFPFPAIEAGGEPGAIVGGIDVGWGLTKAGGQNPTAWKFLSSLVNGPAGTAALADLNDLPAFKDVTLPDSLDPRVVELYQEFMKQLPSAVNQRFASPVVKQALDDALAGVAAGSLSPEDALASVQAAQDKEGPANLVTTG